MRTALVLRIARLEVAAMIAGKNHDRIVLDILFPQRRKQRSHRIVNAFHAPVVIG